MKKCGREVFCAFCEAEATHYIEETETPLCTTCATAYESGQASPNNVISEIEENDDSDN